MRAGARQHATSMALREHMHAHPRTEYFCVVTRRCQGLAYTRGSASALLQDGCMMDVIRRYTALRACTSNSASASPASVATIGHVAAASSGRVPTPHTATQRSRADSVDDDDEPSLVASLSPKCSSPPAAKSIRKYSKRPQHKMEHHSANSIQKPLALLCVVSRVEGRWAYSGRKQCPPDGRRPVAVGGRQWSSASGR